MIITILNVLNLLLIIWKLRPNCRKSSKQKRLIQFLIFYATDPLKILRIRVNQNITIRFFGWRLFEIEIYLKNETVSDFLSFVTMCSFSPTTTTTSCLNIYFSTNLGTCMFHLGMFQKIMYKKCITVEVIDKYYLLISQFNNQSTNDSYGINHVYLCISVARWTTREQIMPICSNRLHWKVLFINYFSSFFSWCWVICRRSQLTYKLQ